MIHKYRLKKPSLKQLFIGILLRISIFSLAQGTVRGVITDSKTNETLIGATLLIQGTTKGASTNIDGAYSIGNIPSGTHTLIVQSMGYNKRLIPNIEVVEGKDTHLDITMSEASIALQGVVVIAKRNLESENILLMAQKESVVAKQAVGAKEMSRKGISDAEAAVAQISGISKQEGVKNVFVRGLGDRYNSTSLNGFPIPSEDPEYKNISLDFFGSDIIKNIGVSKVFSSDNYHDVGGAGIDVSSKELLDEKEFSINLSGGLNTRTLGSDFLQTDGVNYWGIANTTQPGDQFKTLYNYSNSLNPKAISLPLNYSYGFSGGKKYKIGEDANPLTFFVVANYSTSSSYTQESVLKSITDGRISSDLDGKKSSQNINQLVLGNINYMSEKHEISYNFLLLHDNTQSVGEYIGEGNDLELLDNYDGYILRQQINDNLLITNQLLSKFELTKKLELKAGVSYNRVKGSEPDRRINKLTGKYAPLYKPLKPEHACIRTNSELIEDDYNTKFKLSYKLNEKFKEDLSSIHIGYNGRYIFDRFNATEYIYNSSFPNGQTLDTLSLDLWYNQSNYDNGLFQISGGNNNGRRNSEYTVSKLLHSGFASIDYQFNPKLTLNAGLGVDNPYIKVKFNIKDGQKKHDPLQQPLDSIYFLPSLNLKYSLNDKHALRVGLSQTYTLPQSKEISPYLYEGISFSSQGNPDIVPSDNYNLDIKWDYYISVSELLSVTTFYKFIQNPIARTYTGSAAGFFTYENVSEQAIVGGLELEVRKNIFNQTNSNIQKENKLSAGINASYIYSSTQIYDESKKVNIETQLEGAAPWLFNFDLSYNYSHKEKSFTNSLVLSYFSDRVYTIGKFGFENVIEKGTPTLSFVSTSKINKHLSVKLKAKNILDPKYTYTRETSTGEKQALNTYYKGMNLSLGISYKF